MATLADDVLDEADAAFDPAAVLRAPDADVREDSGSVFVEVAFANAASVCASRSTMLRGVVPPPVEPLPAAPSAGVAADGVASRAIRLAATAA